MYDDYNLFRICETASVMMKTLAPQVRLQFAKRLKNMRIEGGFQRARYFAKSLGIEENRYTRYERAEVEPSLTLIHKICELLRVSPNELLGFAGAGGEGGRTPSGFAEPEDDYGHRDLPSEADRHAELLAWRLASEITSIRNRQRVNPGDPLAQARETGRLFQLLRSDPFNTVAGVLSDEALKDLAAERKEELAKLVDAFTGTASRASGATRE
jgi:transcriptional regulator with XRE-family HTH domain